MLVCYCSDFWPIVITFGVGEGEPCSIPDKDGFRRTPRHPATAMQSSSFELRPAKTVDHQKGDETYFFSDDDILAYWLMNQRPVIPIAAFPSNIFPDRQIVRALYGRDYETERVVGELFAARPTIVVTKEDFEEWAFPLSPTFTKNLEEHYTLTHRLLGRSIYRRR